MQEERTAINRNVMWIIVIVSIVSIISLTQSTWDLWKRRDIVGVRKQTLEGIKKKNAELKSQLETVKSPFFIEREAREKLGMAKEGETIILLGSSSNGSPMTNHNTTPETPNWKQWWQLFF